MTLQDATSGIGGEMAGELRTLPSMPDQRDELHAATPPMSDIPDLPLEEEILDEAIPDFK